MLTFAVLAAVAARAIADRADRDEVVLPGSGKRPDAEIAEAAIRALEWNSSVPNEAIKVTVQDGWVTLTGAVDWAFQRWAAIATVRSLIASILGEFGYTVIEAQDGEEALERFTAEPDRIDLCLFDVIMPKKKGEEAYKEISRMQPGTKAIFLSGYEAGVLQQTGMLNEGVPFISKPILPRELLRKMREVLDG